MGLPHFLQNAVAKLRAWGRSKRTTDCSPRSHRSADAFTINSQECAVPVAFRQREQWQFRKRSNGPWTSNATSPHRQLPWNAAIRSYPRHFGQRDYRKELATPAGFEPATTSLEGWCSIQLSYGVIRRHPCRAPQCVHWPMRLYPKLSAYAILRRAGSLGS